MEVNTVAGIENTRHRAWAIS